MRSLTNLFAGFCCYTSLKIVCKTIPEPHLQLSLKQFCKLTLFLFLLLTLNFHFENLRITTIISATTFRKMLRISYRRIFWRDFIFLRTWSLHDLSNMYMIYSNFYLLKTNILSVKQYILNPSKFLSNNFSINLKLILQTGIYFIHTYWIAKMVFALGKSWFSVSVIQIISCFLTRPTSKNRWPKLLTLSKCL